MIIKFLVFRVLFIALCFIVMQPILFSQTSKTTEKLHSKKIAQSLHSPYDLTSKTSSDDFSTFTNSIAHVLSSPFNWDENDLIKAGGFLALTAGSFLLDDEIRNIFLRIRNKTYDDLESIGYFYGAPYFVLPGALAIYLSGSVLENNWLRNTGLMLTETLIVIGIVQVPSRIIFGRARPYTGNRNTAFAFLKGLGQDRASFISGHAAIAFGVSNILSHQIDHPAVTVGLFGLAALTPLARLYDDKHWFSDIVIGTALGMFISEAVINYHDKTEVAKSSFSITPTINGIYFSYRF